MDPDCRGALATLVNELESHVVSLCEHAPFEDGLKVAAGVAPSMHNQSTPSPSQHQHEHLKQIDAWHAANVAEHDRLSKSILGIATAVKNCLNRNRILETNNEQAKHQIRMTVGTGGEHHSQIFEDKWDDAESLQINKLIGVLEERYLRTEMCEPCVSAQTCLRAEMREPYENTPLGSAEAVAEQSDSAQSVDLGEDVPEVIDVANRRRRKNINGSERVRRRKVKEREALALATAQALAQTIARDPGPRADTR